MKECQKKIKKILAICWGMQVAVVAAGGEVKKSSNGSHIGIAFDIELNPNGQRHPIYKGKKNKFNEIGVSLTKTDLDAVLKELKSHPEKVSWTGIELIYLTKSMGIKT